MDQSRYWIQKERSCINPHVLSSFGDSWEEQAFAEDAAGPLGGCIWPPRSYTCSFCRREFRSAQALGGHMNVHRRDRARLKQSPSNNIQILEPNISLGGCNPNEICNPNFDLDHPKTSTTSILRPFTCSFIQEQQKTTPILSWSKFEPRKRSHIADMGNQETSFAKVVESNTKNTHLNSSVRGRCEKNEPENGFIFKRRRIEDDAQSRFLPKASNLLNGDEAKSIVSLECSPNSTLENLDLELRLGERPQSGYM